jgi:hypothetical protein
LAAEKSGAGQQNWITTGDLLSKTNHPEQQDK